MANEPDDNPPSLRETAGTRIEMPSIPLQDNVLLKMLTILQKMDENQQKAEKDRGERENKILGQILVTQDQIVVTQNAMLEMMKAIHITEKTGERWREESSETKSEEDNDKTAFIPPVVQDSTVSTTGHKISGKTVMVGRRNTNIVNNNFSCKMIVRIVKNSDQSSNMDQSNSLERDLRTAICDQNNEVVQELEQMLEATLDEVRAGSIVLVFLTANRNRFRKLFFQHEEKIKHLMENSVKGLLRGTKDSEANYSIDIKIEDDNQDTGKDKSSTGISSTRKDNLHNDEKHSEGEDEDEDDDDDDDDDENKGATSANTYISRISDEKRHKSGIRPEVLGKNKFSSNKCNGSVDGSLRRSNIDKIDEGSSSDNYTSDNNGVNFKKKGVLKNKNRLPLKMFRWQSHGEKSTRQEKFRDDDDDNSDDDKQDNLDGEQRRMVSIFPDVSQEDRTGTLMNANKDDLQNYDNNLDDKDSKDDEDSREKSTRWQSLSVDTGLDIIYRRDQGMSEEKFLHSDRNHLRRKVSKGDRSDDNTRNPGICAKGKDGRGVQRGACKGCNECFEFKGDARCEYCNCAATQHISLIHGSSNLDTTDSTSKLGNLQDPKGKDGRGIQRGKCAGCTECSEFRGDVRCDYCNCTATQHVNLTHLPKDKNGPSTFSREASENAKGKDSQGIQRGNCNGCSECYGFTGDARCDYCNCAATQHVNLTHQPSEKTDSSTFSRGASENAKGKDGRGVKRGKCAGCTDCFEFRGDVRCDYCNCAATQHLNLTRPSSTIDTSRYLPGTSQPAKGKDGRGVKRGKCAGCTECLEFGGDVRCDYCNCAATQHLNLTHPWSDVVVSTSSSGALQLGKSMDGQGIWRGHCKACTKCLQFRGGVRCENCNCAPAQHVNLKYLSSDTTDSRGASQNAKGKDSQGIWRGNCNGCSECLGFTGDARCDYCNCAATQHVNLTHLPTEKTDPSTFSRGASENAKGKDGRGVKRGKCAGCTECLEFRGDVRCDYCNCAATQHLNLTRPSSTIDTSRYLPGTSQPGIDSRGVGRGRCTHCNECHFFTGADRCDYCSCTATEHINLTDTSSNTGFKNNWSDFDFINKDNEISIQKHNRLSEALDNEISIQKDILLYGTQVDVSTKRVLPSLTQNHTLRIGVRSHLEQPDGVSQTDLEQRFNDSIQNKITQIRKDVLDVFTAEFKDIRFEKGSIIIKMLTHRLERDAEIMLMGRREKIENYVKSLVKNILSLQFMNLNWPRHQTLYLEIDMGGIFTSNIVLQL